MSNEKDDKRTFRISMKRECHSNLSGSIMNADTGEKSTFRGVMELIRFIDGSFHPKEQTEISVERKDKL